MATKKISDEDLEWLQAHKKNVERAKHAGIYAFFMLPGLALGIFSGYSVEALNSFYVIVAVIATLAGGAFSLLYDDDNGSMVIISFIFGAIIGAVFTAIAFAPMALIAEYPISMQVFYPNHPNITIIQNCTGFTTTNSGYINGQPINPKNTTQCNLPASMIDNYGIDPFNCNITGKNITCTTSLLDSASLLGASTNITWSGTILNVSKR